METNDTALQEQPQEEEEAPVDLGAAREIIDQIPASPNPRRYLIPTLAKIQDAYRFSARPGSSNC